MRGKVTCYLEFSCMSFVSKMADAQTCTRVCVLILPLSQVAPWRYHVLPDATPALYTPPHPPGLQFVVYILVFTLLFYGVRNPKAYMKQFSSLFYTPFGNKMALKTCLVRRDLVRFSQGNYDDFFHRSILD